ncbi:MAG: type I-F CRISPR-associated endonuclease Cas1f, partial [Sphaerochaetaceae bacterium]|nr:type I-F CRISPR-associated endonuclease Cas1f [Sphaerochaetaceae bacterium]
MDKDLNLKTILHSKRANIYYLEKCRVMLKDNRVTYLTSVGNANNFYNIPIANTTVLLLGTGTSITQAAVRYLSSAGVSIGFCGSGGTPLFSGTEIEFLNSKSEYRETKYIQSWLSFWYDDSRRLMAAKEFQKNRISFINKIWNKDNQIKTKILYPSEAKFIEIIEKFERAINKASNVNELLLSEATFTKSLYALC